METTQQVTPFKGLRYNPSKAGEMAKLVAPPYDVIPPAMQEELYAKDSHNVIRLILGKKFDDDTDANNRYTRSAADLEQWIKDGLLQREEKPAIYVYAQSHDVDGKKITRVGFIARKKLEEFGKSVLPHEKTHSGPKADRLSLMHACRCNFSSIFGLYSDAEKITDKLIATAMGNKPDTDIVTDEGERNQLWVVTDEKWIADLTGAMQEKSIMIADGHHRYETALNYKNELAKKGEASDEINYVMMFFTNTASEGLTILPTHRLVHNLHDFKLEEFLNKASGEFEIEEVPSSNGNRNSAAEDALTSKMKDANLPVFGLYSGGGKYSLLKKKNVGNSGPLDILDVAILHTNLLESLLGITVEEQEKQTKLSYSPDLEKATQSVDKGDSQLAFILNPTPIEHMEKVVEAGLKMPQKSTYFYPKLVSGLVINPLY